MGWSEQSLHTWLGRRLGKGQATRLQGAIGHDAALLKLAGRRLAVCVDQCVEGVHYDASTPPRKAGQKAAARSLSDLAATAALPRAVLVALRAPAGALEKDLRGLLDGVLRFVQRHAALLVGGDLCCAPGPVSLAVTALGEAPARGRPPGRDRATIGQDVLLTGPVGGSRLGRHLDIQPRLSEGRWLHAAGATGIMDVSDGLAIDLDRLARASGVRIDLEHLPIHRDARRAACMSGNEAGWHALSDGEDHELIATLSPGRAADALRRSAGACPGLTRVGRVRSGRGLWIVDQGGRARRWDGRGGWRHGG